MMETQNVTCQVQCLFQQQVDGILLGTLRPKYQAPVSFVLKKHFSSLDELVLVYLIHTKLLNLIQIKTLFLQHLIDLDVLASNRLFTIRQENGFRDTQLSSFEKS